MASYIKEDYLTECDAASGNHSYLPNEVSYRTDMGINEEETVPILSGDDNIFSDINVALGQGTAYEKASSFIAEFTRVFAKTKTQDRAYSKFIQNLNELPDVELDWVFQYFRVSFLFCDSDEDYYCITKYDENSRKYESKTGPLNREDYRVLAEEVMQEVG